MQYQVSAPANPAMSFLPLLPIAGHVASNYPHCSPDERGPRSSHGDHDADFDGPQYRQWLKWSGIL